MGASLLGFGRWLRRVRTEKKQSQEAAGAACGVGKQAFSHWESGRRRPGRAELMLIAKWAGVEHGALMKRLPNGGRR